MADGDWKIDRWRRIRWNQTSETSIHVTHHGSKQRHLTSEFADGCCGISLVAVQATADGADFVWDSGAVLILLALGVHGDRGEDTILRLPRLRT